MLGVLCKTTMRGFLKIFLNTHCGAGMRRNKNIHPNMTKPVHNSVTSRPWSQEEPLLAHGDQETRQLAVMQGQTGVMLVHAYQHQGES